MKAGMPRGRLRLAEHGPSLSHSWKLCSSVFLLHDPKSILIYCSCCCLVASVVSDSVRPHRRQPTRLPHPWDSLGKNTGVGCHFLLQCMKMKSESEVTQLCPTLSDPMDCSLPGSSVHGIFRQEYWSGVPVPSLILMYSMDQIPHLIWLQMIEYLTIPHVLRGKDLGGFVVKQVFVQVALIILCGLDVIGLVNHHHLMAGLGKSVNLRHRPPK